MQDLNILQRLQEEAKKGKFNVLFIGQSLRVCSPIVPDSLILSPQVPETVSLARLRQDTHLRQLLLQSTLDPMKDPGSRS